MLALFPGCSHAQVYPVLVAQHAKRNFTKHMVNIGREMGNLQITTYTHTHAVMYLPQIGLYQGLPACLSTSLVSRWKLDRYSVGLNPMHYKYELDF